MSDNIRGWRAVPPALAIALGTWLGFVVFRLVWMVGATGDRIWSVRISLAGEGVGTAALVLALAGTLELIRRSTGRVSLGLKCVAAGFALSVLLDVSSSLLAFDDRMWEREWV